jgi:dTDP-4-amino-4,6-dideoxygalactose transaminase
MIPFNKPHFSGREVEYVEKAIRSGKVSGDGPFTKACHRWLEERLGAGRAFLTSSCTDALEAAALLCEIEMGDEVILPSYTFVSTANAFALRGATLKFVDSTPTHPNMDADMIEELVNERTRVIVPVHYAGMACDMGKIVALGDRYNLWVVEDAAQAICSTYRDRSLGTFGDLAAFSFHETKNLTSGEGGSLHVNDPNLVLRAEIVREKGTNRSAFFRGEIDKYGWVDIGSSFLSSDITAAVLLAQLEACDAIQDRRLGIWQRYWRGLSTLKTRGVLELPELPAYATNNAHMFYIVLESLSVRTEVSERLRTEGISAPFHYQSLHSSRFFAAKHDGRSLPNSDRYSDCLLRLPLYHDLSDNDVDRICEVIRLHFGVRG